MSLDWTYNYMDYPVPEKKLKKDMRPHDRSLFEREHNLNSEIPYTNHLITKQKKNKMKNQPVSTTDSNVTNMKPKSGTAKPSGAGVGKGGPKTSPTDGRSLKPSGAKGGKMKKGGALNK